MNKEIKEILDRLERIDHKEYIAFEFADSATFDEMARCFEERKKLADYITNLQEENDYLKMNSPEQNIEHFRIIKENKRKIDLLRKQNKKLQEENEMYAQLKDEYEDIIDKAIEYFKYQLENLDFYEDTKARMLCAMGIVLLQGEDNE